MDSTATIDVDAALANDIIKILREWHLETEEQVALLGLPETTRNRALVRLAAHGGNDLNQDFLPRGRYLSEIKSAIDTLFPFNAHAASLWVTTPNTYFNNMSPVRVMIVEGIPGMQRVLNHLNGDSGWS